MRLRIFLLTYVPLILFVISFIFYRWPNGEAINRFIAATLMAMIIFKILLSDRKYISNISLTESGLGVQYINQFLNSKSLTIPLEDIIDIKLHKSFWLSFYAGTILVKLQNDTVEYHIFKKSQLQDIEQLLGSRQWGRPLSAIR